MASLTALPGLSLSSAPSGPPPLYPPLTFSASTLSVSPASPPSRDRKKRRERQSCRQCQARRCACSRESPCKSCVMRGEGDQCDWTGAKPLIVHGRLAGSPRPVPDPDRAAQLARSQDQIRLNNELRGLANKVDHLVNLLQRSQASAPHHLPGSSNNRSHFAGISSAPETVPVANYYMEDVATQLSRFTLSQAVRGCSEHPFERLELGTDTYSPRICVKELEEYMDQDQSRPSSQVNFNIGSSSSSSHWTAPQTALPTSTRNTSTMVSSAASSPTMQGLLGLGSGLETMGEVMGNLPTDLQIKTCLEQFETHRAWMHRILHRQQLWNQVYEQISQNFPFYRSLKTPVDILEMGEYRRKIHWLAILFGICGLGLFNNLLNDSQALQSGFPSGKRLQRELAVRWCRCSTSCLQLGEYDRYPTMESIQAMAILAQLPLYTSNGETLGIVLGFLGTAIELASKINLNIDPDEDPNFKNSSALVKQNRRRLMITLLCQHFKMGGLACQTVGLKSPSDYKLKLPLDQFDEDFDLATGALMNPRRPGSTHTIMTGIRCRFQVSRVWQEIGILFADVNRPPVHEQIMALDRQLVEIEKNWPRCIRTRFEPSNAVFVPAFTLQADRPGLVSSSVQHPILLIDRLGCFSVLANAMIRLHRGFLVAHDGIPTQDVALHRARILHYGRSMLAVHRTMIFPLDNVPLQFFVFTSSIALAVYCLTENPMSDEFDQVMKEINQLVETLKPMTHISSILRRTYGVMSYLIKKINARIDNEQPQDQRLRKKSRIDHSKQSNQNPQLQHLPTHNISTPKQISNYPTSSLVQTSLIPPKDLSFDIHSFESLSRSLQQDIDQVFLVKGFELNHDKSTAQAIQSIPESLFDLGPLLENGPLSEDQTDFIFGSSSSSSNNNNNNGTLGHHQIGLSPQSNLTSSPAPVVGTNGSFIFGNTTTSSNTSSHESFKGLFPNCKF